VYFIDFDGRLYKNSTVGLGQQLKNYNSGGGKDINAQILTIASEEDQNQTELLQMQAKVDVLTRRLESLEKQFRAGNSKVLAEA
jgi:polyhydroxyalkanoate synthesis regulator phasin